MSQRKPRVGLFVTCLVDLFRPTVAFAAVKLLEQAGCEVVVPPSQACCGQPAYNNGDQKDARKVAAVIVDAFQDVDFLVAPSGSCAGMIRKHYAELFADDPKRAEPAKRLADRSHELVSFLVDICGMDKVDAELDAKVTYHDSCSGLRELGVKGQPRKLLASIKGISVEEIPGAETCCGFGGTFCVKYPDISGKMVDNKAEEIEASGAEMILAGDMGCLMNIAGKLKRRGSDIQVRHVAEVLAGMTDQVPPIAEPKQ